MKKDIFISAGIILLFVFGFLVKQPGITQDQIDMYQKDAVMVIADSFTEKFAELDIEDCPCDGSGVITHGDGHKTPCSCLASGECKCKSENTGARYEP